MAIKAVQNLWSPTFWEQVNSRIDAFSDDFMYHSLLPTMKAAYRNSGPPIAQLAGKIRPQWKEKVEALWEAPIALEMAHKLTTKAEEILKSLALRTPTEVRGLKYFDATLISMAQHLYPYTKQTLYFLDLPQQIKDFASRFSLDDVSQKLRKVFGTGWKVVSFIRYQLKKLVFFALDYLVRAVDYISRLFLLNHKIGMIGYVRAIIKEVRTHIYDSYIQMAHRAVDHHSEALRVEITKEVADTSVDYVGSIVGRLGFKTAGVVALLSLATFPVIQGAAVVGLTPVLWKEGIKPLLDPYHDTYEPNFQLQKSYLKLFAEQFPAVKPFVWKLKVLNFLHLS